ncbi:MULTISPECIES: DNA-binding protein [Psychrobacter]|jgi:predicted nuclease with TOPRIM domain|uniref:Plasmid replication DNA-binding protein KfrA n=1 Tax=Psychrobacter immobilis TaxID=498 RepID=A0A2V1ZMN2_PSYIM|nr:MULTISPECIES: DNA-binding protein [Psychrobacter]PWK05935.1 plasmid replication DNA-binding protein KfrA [Psychrobacter immobilis]
MAITIQQIHATADQLQEQGIKPTLAEVRKALGGGSFTTISEAMKSWRQDNQEEEQLRQVELPSGIAERLQSLGADMWQTAIDIANDRLVKEREALESIKTKAQAETDEAQEAVKTLESEQADLLGQLDEVTATAEAAAITAAQVTAERDTLLQTLSDTQHALELEQAKTDAAQAQLAELRSSFDQQAKELNVNLSKVAALEATAHSDKAEISRLQIELIATKDELKKVTTERNEIATDTAEVKGELKAIVAERNKLSGLNDQLTQTQAKLEAEHSVLNKQYSELSSHHLSEQEQVTLLQDQLKKAQDALILIQNKDNTLDAD